MLKCKRSVTLPYRYLGKCTRLLTSWRRHYTCPWILILNLEGPTACNYQHTVLSARSWLPATRLVVSKSFLLYAHLHFGMGAFHIFSTSCNNVPPLWEVFQHMFCHWEIPSVARQSSLKSLCILSHTCYLSHSRIVVTNSAHAALVVFIILSQPRLAQLQSTSSFLLRAYYTIWKVWQW